METHELLLVALAVGIVAVDALIRLRLASRRRKRFLEELLPGR